jgi:CBS domain containing-hemolysin-like protein
MASFISTFITVGICLAIYAYLKKKYSDQIAALESQIASLNLDIIKSNTRNREMETKLFVKERESESYKNKLETMVDINKGLVSAKSIVIEPTKLDSPKKRGRKPGSKKPYYKKKSGGNPS